MVDKKARINTSSTANAPFPIVGIGASAGGLEAIEQFLSNVPPDSGMAFVVVQHLDPNHKDIMCELLQRVTPLKVKQIRDRMVVKPNHMYVTPPRPRFDHFARCIVFVRTGRAAWPAPTN